jgi:uncharacterized protein
MRFAVGYESVKLRLTKIVRGFAGNFSRQLLFGLIRGYQYSIGLVIPPSCRYLPTCSEYAQQAVNDFGPLHGSYLALKRVCRCHPLAAGGLDEVPSKNS